MPLIQAEQLVSSNDEFICKICLLVLNEPLIAKCSHMFCASCFSDWVAKLKSKNAAENALIHVSCPICVTSLKKTEVAPLQEQAQSNSTGSKMLLNMYMRTVVRCANHTKVRSDGWCTWEGTLEEYEKHVDGCKNKARNVRLYFDTVQEFISHADWEASSENEMSISCGELIEARCQERNWMFGRRKGVHESYGWFPKDYVFANYVQGSLFRVYHEYKATSAEEHNLKSSQYVKVMDSEKQWVCGIVCDENGNELGAKCGWFPDTSIRPR